MVSEQITMSELAREHPAARLEGDGSVVVRDVTHDSRQAGPGSLFVAVKGFTSDGHAFIPEVVAKGGEAVCVERKVQEPLTQLIVDDTRSMLAPLAARVHGHPSRSLAVVGVTGTNGKTTVAHMIERIVDQAGDRAGVIGTLGARSAGRPVPISRTTPEATDLQRVLAHMVADAVSTVAMEVSSHALELGRVGSVDFAVAAFTNLSQDHLDFHQDLDAYFEAKASLFDPARVANAVIVVDDQYGKRLADALAAGPLASRMVTVSLAGNADVTASEIRLGPDSSTFTVSTPSGTGEVALRMAGRFNVSNALVAVATCLQLGYALTVVCEGLASFEGVAGRMQSIDAGQPFSVIVDYAHTPAGVGVAISTAREIGSGRIIAVVGAAGDRDQAKRPLMGAAASGADVVVVTSDNPRSEDPAEIVAQVAAGVTASSRLVEVDRRDAIRAALSEARAGDVVLVLGRGHEPFQEIAGTRLPFLDAQVVEEEWRFVEVGASTLAGSPFDEEENE